MEPKLQADEEETWRHWIFRKSPNATVQGGPGEQFLWESAMDIVGGCLLSPLPLSPDRAHSHVPFLLAHQGCTTKCRTTSTYSR